MLWRITNGELENQNPKLIVINAGTNQFSVTPNYNGDSPEIAFAGVKQLIKTLHQLLPGSEILVMAVFPRQPEEVHRQAIDRLNQLLGVFLAGEGGRENNARFLDITGQFRTPDGRFNSSLYADGVCHPNEAGYRIWAQALEPEIIRCLKQQPVL